MSGVDKTAKARQAHLYDMIMIGVLVVPVIILAVMSLILVFRHNPCMIDKKELE